MRYGLIILAALLLTWGGTSLAQETPPAAPDAVVSVIEYPDLPTGLAGKAAYLAPDGLSFAHIDGTEICIYVLPEQEPSWCVTAEDEYNRRIDLEEVRWSPDSRYLSFSTNEFLRMLRDPDIWVVDTEAQTATNITDDGDARLDIFNAESEWPPIDLMPRWSADSARILFMRIAKASEEGDASLDLYTIAPDGSDLQQVGTIATEDRFPVYALDWSADGEQLTFNYYIGGSDNEADNGVWISGMDGSEPRQILTTDLANVPQGVTFSPDMTHVLLYSGGYVAFYGAEATPEHSPARLVNLESGEELLIDESHLVMSAGWSPTGQALAYVVRDLSEESTESGLYITPSPGEAGQQVYEGRVSAPTPLWYAPLMWAANDTVLLSKAPEKGLVVLQLGAEGEE